MCIQTYTMFQCGATINIPPNEAEDRTADTIPCRRLIPEHQWVIGHPGRMMPGAPIRRGALDICGEARNYIRKHPKEDQEQAKRQIIDGACMRWDIQSVNDFNTEGKLCQEHQ